MFCDVSASFLSNAPLPDCERSLGQDIMLKCTNNTKSKDENKDLGTESLSYNEEKNAHEQYGSSPTKETSNSDHKPLKVSEPYSIAKHWQQQIEQAKLLDVSNNQCQNEGTYEQAYQTLDVSMYIFQMEKRILLPKN